MLNDFRLEAVLGCAGQILLGFRRSLHLPSRYANRQCKDECGQDEGQSDHHFWPDPDEWSNNIAPMTAASLQESNCHASRTETTITKIGGRPTRSRHLTVH